MYPFNKSYFALLFLIFACGSPGEKSGEESADNMDRRTEIRLKQYMVKGKELYQTYCMNCHLSDGKGLAQLYPPLAESDYLLEDLPRAACIIKHGKADGVTVNGVLYTQMMPPNPSLSPLEIAEILTYITNSWGNKKGLSSTKDVAKWLEQCE